MVPQGGRRASGRRGGSGSDAEHLARQSPKTSHKLVGSWGCAGAADRGDPPPPAMAAGVARATGGSFAVRTPARYPAHRPGRFGPGWLQCRSGKFGRGTGRPPGGGCKRALERTVLLKGGLQPPPRPTRPRGSTTAGRDRIDALGRRLRQTGDVGWIANEADPGGGGRARARPAWRPATIHAAKGGTGRPPGGCKRALERTFFTRAACSPPRAIQGPKPFSNGLAPRSPATRARISSKAADPRGISGKAADWRCIHAHFPVKNQVIP